MLKIISENKHKFYIDAFDVDKCVNICYNSYRGDTIE